MFQQPLKSSMHTLVLGCLNLKGCHILKCAAANSIQHLIATTSASFQSWRAENPQQLKSNTQSITHSKFMILFAVQCLLDGQGRCNNTLWLGRTSVQQAKTGVQFPSSKRKEVQSCLCGCWGEPKWPFYWHRANSISSVCRASHDHIHAVLVHFAHNLAVLVAAKAKKRFLHIC